MTQSLHAPMSETHPARSIAQGVWPVMCTPFKEDGSLDLEKVPELVDFYLNAGCVGVFPVAGSGEMFHLAHAERCAMARATVEAVGGRAQVLASGNFGEDLDAQAEAIRQVADTGVNAVVLVLSIVPLAKSPWAHEDLVDQILRLSEKVNCRLGMYECPSPEHRVLRPEDVKRIAASGRFDFLKETTQDRDWVAEKVRARDGTPMALYPASLKVFTEPWIEGVGGYNGIIGNIVPEVFVRINQLAEGNQPYCSQIRELLFEIERRFLNELYPASGKVLLRMRGLSVGTRARAGKNPVLSEAQLAELAPLKELIDQALTLGVA